jgi:hypothetical protein
MAEPDVEQVDAAFQFGVFQGWAEATATAAEAAKSGSAAEVVAASKFLLCAAHFDTAQSWVMDKSSAAVVAQVEEDTDTVG